MEVLPCTGGVHYVGQSDCPQQGSEKAFVYDKKANCLEHEQVGAAEVKVDSLVLDVEAPPEEQPGQGDWTVNELPTEGHCNGDSYSEFEVDGQKLSFDSHDSEDDFTGASVPSENSQLAISTIGSALPCRNQEGDSCLSAPRWLEQDQPIAVWVKWRGNWQAGIRCARSDWPLSTLRAKPTHDRKQYIVIFFPRRRNYSWADVLLLRPIDEYPHPIAYRSHKVGVKIVKDLTLARRFIMQKLAVSMLNFIEQLHSEALIETARNMVVWKDFAMEASQCKGYSDLGRMLLKLENMILQCCLNSHWREHSLPSWEQRCQNAHSAESLELLKEELVDSIMWNEVHLLQNAAMQPDMGSDWKSWKQEVMKWFTMSNPSSTGEMEHHSNDSPSTMGLQISRKRPKLEIRRAEMNASQAETQGLHQSTTLEIDSEFFDGRDAVNAALLGSAPTKDESPVVGAQPIDYPGNAAYRWGEIVVEAGNTEIAHSNDVEMTPVNGLAPKKLLDPMNKNRQCKAFIEAKGRQCVRWANEGDVYCCVHLASRFVGNSTKLEATPPVDAPMCEGTTVLGTKCKHRSLPGSSFCKKHRPQNHTRVTSSSPENKLKRKHETTSCKELVLVEQFETPLLVDPISVVNKETFDGSSSLILVPEQSEILHCIGSVPQDGSVPCPESPKRHSLYCEKHLPSWLKRARNGKSRIVSKEVFLDLLKGCHSREQKLHLHQACELFYRLFKSILSLRNPVPKEVQLQWAISEASKDTCVGEFLMKLVCSEKERLTRLWGFKTDKDVAISSTVEEPVTVLTGNDSDDGKGSIFKCKICSEKVSDDEALGMHWMDNHKKEAQWLFRGYVCAICLDSFTNKKVLEAHVQERHHVQFVEQCMLFQCIPCGSHFGNPDQLWLHVLSVHPANFRPPRPGQQQNPSMDEHSAKTVEPPNPFSAEKTNNQGGSRRFKCRFCGLKFDLLPDLGRHHQAAHMGPNSAGPRLPKRGIRYYAYKLKSGRLTRPRFKKGLGAASYKIRNRGAISMKKRIQAPNSVSSGEAEEQSSLPEAATSLGRLAESQCAAVAKLLYSEIKKTKPRPSNLEILATARSACCKVSLQALLEKKYGLLPERLYLKAAKLCSEHNIIVDWHQEGYICPRGCKSSTDPLMSPLIPLSDSLVGSKTVASAAPATSEWAMDECHYIIDFKHSRQEAVQRTIMLCDDISFGQESVPVACVVDENLLGSLYSLVDGSDGTTNEHSLPWESFTYVMKPLLDQSLDLVAQSLQLGCACKHATCSSETCDHVYLFDNDYEDAKDIYGKPMSGRFPYDDKGRIILEEGYLVYECNQSCSCSRICPNRILQNGVRMKLEVFKTEEKGWAVRAGEQILRGTFVCEYIGEVIDEQEAKKRRDRIGREGCSYLFDIDAHINDMSRFIEGQGLYVIDATNYGNVSRYINHSCSPNLVSHQVLVESMDCQLAHIGLYASRDITVGEELTYDYRYKVLPGEGYPCRCGASNCRGRLY